MVASMDPKAAIYSCEVRVQEREKVSEIGGKMEKSKIIEEIILDTEDMVKRLLKKFFDFNRGLKPQRIVYYRDGVSEGQFQEALDKELSAIQRACKSLQKEDYEPPITFIVAQKRHKTRLFPDNPKDGVGRMGNVPPGTVVDTVITNPTEENFFLVSHEGIQGTSRPTGYHVLFDDNKLSADDKQKLTFYLCHLYSRCERSVSCRSSTLIVYVGKFKNKSYCLQVSYPAPTYYAHLAAFRAREHHNSLIDKKLDKNKDELEKLYHPGLVDYFM